jgi:hypothetical protein
MKLTDIQKENLISKLAGKTLLFSYKECSYINNTDINDSCVLTGVTCRVKELKECYIYNMYRIK